VGENHDAKRKEKKAQKARSKAAGEGQRLEEMRKGAPAKGVLWGEDVKSQSELEEGAGVRSYSMS